MINLNLEFINLNLTRDRNISIIALGTLSFDPELSCHLVGCSFVLKLCFFIWYSKSTSKAHLVISNFGIIVFINLFLNNFAPHWVSRIFNPNNAFTRKLKDLEAMILISFCFGLTIDPFIYLDAIIQS